MNPKRATEILDAIKGKRILVIGDVMLDQYIYGKAERISVEVPVPIVEEERRSSGLGGAGNAALNAATLGVGVTFISVVGDDDAGAEIRNGKRHQGFREWWVFEDPHRKTTTKTRVIANGHQVLRMDSEDHHPLSHETERRVMDNIAAAMNWATAVLVSDYGKGFVTSDVAAHTLQLAERREVIVVIDPKPANWGNYTAWLAPMVLTPNSRELTEMALAIRADTLAGPDALDTNDALYVGVSLDALDVVETCGSDGIRLHAISPESTPEHYEAVTDNAVDVSGAGDTVSAVITACMAAHIPLHEAAELANIAAGVAVCKPGCATVEPEEIIAVCA